MQTSETTQKSALAKKPWKAQNVENSKTREQPE